MQDERGHYYHAIPGESSVRVYVRKGENGYEFRLWNRDHPEVWDKHKWVDYAKISEAAELYKREYNSNADPLKIYDLAIARNLLDGSED